ncbi:MAG: hypothetical protein H6867_05905 [Rhodospirillales bacterium]|nr:hypothetical protein [Rhodospirillales bacterium]MCB9995062.1 hypothetical protein [Rhodospirillales bacterium]
MADIRMDEARYTDPENGDVQVVQLPGTNLRGGNIHYNEALHKGHLTCRFCDAAVHHHNGSKRIAGDNLNGASQHFHTNRGQTHGSDCAWPEINLRAEKTTAYNDHKGYKIHLNIPALRQVFKKQAGRLYVRNEEKKLINLVPDLEDRRPRSMDSLAAIIDLIKKSDTDRLRGSVVVNQGHIVPWDRFLVRHDYRGEKGQQRFGGLIRALQQGQTGPCLMEVFNDKAGHKGNRRMSRPMHWYTDDHGRDHVIVPTLWLEERGLYPLMTREGRYLALGYPRHHAQAQGPDKVVHYLNMSIRDPAQLAAASLPLIAQEAKANRQRRHGPA